MEVNTIIEKRGKSSYLIALFPSASDPNKFYRTDVTNNRCDCPAWKFSKTDAMGLRKPCKHLVAFYADNDDYKPAMLQQPLFQSEPEPFKKIENAPSWFKQK